MPSKAIIVLYLVTIKYVQQFQLKIKICITQSHRRKSYLSYVYANLLHTLSLYLVMINMYYLQNKDHQPLVNKQTNPNPYSSNNERGRGGCTPVCGEEWNIVLA